jgi:hypothetical protein
MQPHPVLYQLNTRVYLSELSQKLARRATLADIPDAFLAQLAERGVQMVWLLSVWTTGPRSQQESRRNPEWLHEFSRVLDDLQTEDIGGSGFAIADYRVSEQLGGPKSLEKFRARLSKHGMQLMLDFVPNHMGLDHPWLKSHPEYFVAGTQELRDEQPQNYFLDVATSRIFAHGRDPYFSGWSDTVQLDYSNSELHEQMQKILLSISDQCDAVRCDMAMLLTPRVFERTWGRQSQSFWQSAIHRVKSKHPGFVFMAEVYWDMEWELQEEGFDYCYDKRLYDRLRDRDYLGVRNHLRADLSYQSKLARFLENHDEPRAAGTFGFAQHATAAAASFLTPGLRFFHHGQWTGSKIKVSPHLIRGPKEPADEQINDLYQKITGLLKDPIFHRGDWQLLEVQRAWDENWSSDCLLAWLWHDQSNESKPGRVVLCIANLADHEAQGKIEIPKWLRPMSSLAWKNIWSDEAFAMPTDQWDSGWWTLYAQGSQVFVLESVGQ